MKSIKVERGESRKASSPKAMRIRGTQRPRQQHGRRPHPHRTHRRRLSANNGPAKNYEPACSGVVLYLGLKKRYDHVLHHNFVFSRDPHEEFEYIYKKGEPAPDPTAYLACPSLTEPAVAPEGGEALYVLVHTPFLRKHHDWAKMLPAYRKTIHRKTEAHRRHGRHRRTHRLRSATSHRKASTTATRVLNGAIYGLASHGKYFGAFKPSNKQQTSPRPLPRRRSRPPRPRHAHGHDVRLDRRRRARQGFRRRAKLTS